MLSWCGKACSRSGILTLRIWIRGFIEVRLVTSHACCRQGCVVIVDVALRALNRCMRAGQRKRCVVVIEARKGPRRSVVALCAVCGEP